MRIHSAVATLLKLSIATGAVGCAAPVMRPPAISPEAVRAEQLKQQQLVIQSILLQTQRLEDIGHPLLTAATGFCERYVTVRSGVTFANAHAFGRTYEVAARTAGFSDTLLVSAVAKGSAAERAGVRPGDRVLTLGGRPAPRGTAALSEAAKHMAVIKQGTTLSMTLQAGPLPGASEMVTDDSRAASYDARPRAVALEGDKACPFGLVVADAGAINAFADGRNVIVNSAMMRFTSDDDELALVVAHEIAHNALRHIEAKQNNATLGGLFGAILDVAAASQGINTQGGFTKSGMNAGALVFSQEFELEADYVGLYMLARAGRNVAHAPRFWREMAIANRQSIIYSGTHPTTAERFVRLEAAVGEVQTKLARGEIPSPERRGPAPSVPSQVVASASAAARGAPDTRTATINPPAASTSPPKGATDRADPPASRAPDRAPDAPAPSRPAASPPGGAARPVNAIPGDPAAEKFTWTYGPPVPRNGLTLSQVKSRARMAWVEGAEAREVGWLDRAREKFFEATQLDGTEATYHAALGGVLLAQGLLVEAEGVLSAAVLLEPGSQAYRLLLAEVRLRRLQREVRPPK